MYGLGNLGNKVTAFTARVVKASIYLEGRSVHKDLVSQFRRSGTSIGANCSEAVGAQSNADYRSKLSIALKEGLETQHWIEVLRLYNAIDDAAYQSIMADCVEICKILTTIINNVTLNIDAEQARRKNI